MMPRTLLLALRYLSFTVGLLGFTALLYLFERRYGGGPWIAYLFLFATVAVYAVIGMLSRTSDMREYYVAGRGVPAVFNGMATAADWLSAASFIGLAGSLFVHGYNGLAYIVGWTGGFCLVAVLLAPYVRKMARYTLPDFLAIRYDSAAVRAISAGACILCSFVYLVAQIQGVGLIAARFIGVDVSVGIVFGLAGVLVCSFLGGMRAVTWTQVAQYLILIVAMLLTVSLIGHRLGFGWLPQTDYGRAIARVQALEAQLRNQPVSLTPRGTGTATSATTGATAAATAAATTAPPATTPAISEALARAHYRTAAAGLQARIDGLPGTLDAMRAACRATLQATRERNASLRDIDASAQACAALPATPARAHDAWQRQREALLLQAANPVPIAEPDPAATPAERRESTINFIALVLSLTLGTASLPHVLTRYATAPTVRSARRAVGWTLFFISLFYLSVPVLAVLVKLSMLETLPGSALAHLPDWLVQWQQTASPLITVDDPLHDGVVHWAALRMQPDMVVLAAPDIVGLPYVITGLVAAGALAAALSTADGLLLTIANILSHDVYFKMINGRAGGQRRVMLSKLMLLGVAVAAAYLATRNGGDILFLVGAAFSLAASGLFPVLVLGVFWPRMTRRGAVAAMLAGLAVCVYYLCRAHPAFAHLLGWSIDRWFGVAAASAGVFGVPTGFIVGILVSWFDQPVPEAVRQRAAWLRLP